MAIDFEEALAGKHGDIVRETAERAIALAVERMAEMAAAASNWVPFGEAKTFATGGVVGMPPPTTIMGLDSGEYVVPRRP